MDGSRSTNTFLQHSCELGPQQFPETQQKVGVLQCREKSDCKKGHSHQETDVTTKTQISWSTRLKALLSRQRGVPQKQLSRLVFPLVRRLQSTTIQCLIQEMLAAPMKGRHPRHLWVALDGGASQALAASLVREPVSSPNEGNSLSSYLGGKRLARTSCIRGS